MCYQSSLRDGIVKECFSGGKEECNCQQGQGADDKGRNVQPAIPPLYLSVLGPLTDSKQKPAGKKAMEKQFSEISFLRPRWGQERMVHRQRGAKREQTSKLCYSLVFCSWPSPSKWYPDKGDFSPSNTFIPADDQSTTKTISSYI